MRAFACDVCGQQIYFENSVCVSCGSALAYSRERGSVASLKPDQRICSNLNLNGCNWLAEPRAVDGPGALTERNGLDGQCFSCSLTRTRPADADLTGLSEYYTAEHAKRRLVYELDQIGLPITTRREDPDAGLAFDLLSSVAENVVTGHDDGVITLDLAEGNDAHREQLRLDLDEPYRTMLGHFRHEIGHYYWQVLIDGTDNLNAFRELFGDDRVSYQEAIDRHYSQGPPVGWENDYVSKYATMHPWEDFAETFAHVLHIRDTLQTASEYKLIIAVNTAALPFRSIVEGIWLPLTYGLNQINRSMGREDLYPFVLAPRALDKLVFVADVVNEAASSLRV